MAKLQLDAPHGLNVNVVITDVSSGSLKVWNKSTLVFEVPVLASIANYGIAATESALFQTYSWTIPAALPPTPAGFAYTAKAYTTTGANLASGDVSSSVTDSALVDLPVTFVWDGTHVVYPSTSGIAGTATRRTWFVRTTGSDTANTGQTAISPFATLARAFTSSVSGDNIDVDIATASLFGAASGSCPAGVRIVVEPSQTGG